MGRAPVECQSQEHGSAFAGPAVDLINSLTTRNFCEVLLRQLNRQLRVDHCALLRLAPNAPVQIFGARGHDPADPRAARALVAYLDRLYRADPIRQAFGAAGPGALLLRRERSADLPPSAYRRACYEEADFVERVSLARRDSRAGWIVLDLHRRSASGPLAAEDCTALKHLAPLLLAACLRHVELLLHAGADAESWRARLAAAYPGMSGRELDVAAQLLSGRTLRESASALGVAYSSVVTYCGRAYSRLGVASLRELRSRFAALAQLAA